MCGDQAYVYGRAVYQRLHIVENSSGQSTKFDNSNHLGNFSCFDYVNFDAS